MKEQRRNRMSHTAKERSGWSLLAVQSILCGVVLLIALLFRLIGGEAWMLLRSLFRQQLTEEGLAETVITQAASGEAVCWNGIG